MERLLIHVVFKGINKKALPVQYYFQKNAWVNSDIFCDWFHNQFVPAVTKHLREKGLPVKALLLLDNAPTHPDTADMYTVYTYIIYGMHLYPHNLFYTVLRFD